VSRSIDRSAFALTIGVSIAALAWDPFAEASDPKRVIALLVAVVGCAVSIARVGSRIEGGVGAPAWERWPRAWKCAAAFVALSTLSLIWGTTAGTRDLATWVAAIVVAASAARLGRERAMSAARATGVLVGAVSSSHAIVAWLGGARGLAVHGLQGNANWLGLVLAIAIPLTLDAALRARSFARGAALVVVALESIALVLAHARVAWVAIAVAAIVTIPWKNMRISRRGAMATVAAIALTIGACRGAGVEASTSPSSASSSTHDAPAPVAIAGRWWIAKNGAAAALASLPFGAGLGRWTHVYLTAQGRALDALPVREAARRFLDATTAHDDYVQSAVESGPFAAIALALFFVFAARELRSKWRAGSAATIAIGVSAFGDDPLHRPAVVLLLALVVATLAPDAREAEDASEARNETPRRRAVSFALAAISALLLFVSTRAWIGAHLRTLARDRDPFARVTLLQRAARVDPTDGETDFELGAALLSIDEPERALVALQRSTPRFANVGTFVAMGNADLALGRTSDAIDAYFSAISLDPGSFKAHVDLSVALLDAGRLDEAEHHARVALSLEPGVDRVRALLDRIAEARMDAATN
jgi:Flp pilus assembly protein TadD